MIELLHTDCMAYMATLPDKAFQLAITDPPYGIDIAEKSARLGKLGTTWGSGGAFKYYPYSEWDKAIPEKEYFEELKRVSSHIIVWGGNYFNDFLGKTKCMLIWDKVSRDDRSDCEIAWTNFNKPSKIFSYSRADAYINDCDIKIHPTQKPIKLYKWLLKNYAKEGDRILDTHLGSGSSAIAAFDGGFDFVGCEIDTDYYTAAKRRFEYHRMQLKLL